MFFAELGIYAYVLILLYIMSIFFKRNCHGWIFDWGLNNRNNVYFLQYLWQNLHLMIEQYQSNMLSCVVAVFTGNVSFVVCY